MYADILCVNFYHLRSNFIVNTSGGVMGRAKRDHHFMARSADL